MSAIRLYYPNKPSATATIAINPIHVPNGVQYTRTPFQKRLVADGGKEYIVKLSDAVELLLDLHLVDLPESDSRGYSGWVSLLAFVTDKLDWSMNLCGIQDADDVLTARVRLWSSAAQLREMEGKALRAGFFTGDLRFRQTLG